MSLLLDALKKAAEKKAQKNADKSVDNTEITRTQLSEDTVIDQTSIDKTVSLTETRVDTTQLDKTELDATQVDSEGHEETQLDVTPVDTTAVTEKTITETPVLQKETHEEPSHSEKPASESTLEMDVRQLDLSRLAREQAEDDETLSFIDDEELNLEIEGSADTDFDSSEDQTLMLTPDDITEFMGDGYLSEQPQEKKPAVTPAPPTPPPQVSSIGSDDTTITNSDSLSLTNIDQDGFDQDPAVQDQTRTQTASYGGFDAKLSLEPLQDDESAADLDEDDYPTIMNADTTAPSVDIEKLTNDETVTIKDSTFTRTFAPDNYDRTLVKLSDSDVSRIFPGMKSESDKVMTPDYAKKIFITKSRGVKNYYYKVYTGVAICILLIVVFWGLFEIQSESESIDNNLVALKRDPMPGIIKSKVQDDRVNLFAPTPEVNNQAIKVIEMASEPESGLSEVGSMDSTSEEEVPAEGLITSEQGAGDATVPAAPESEAASPAAVAPVKTRQPAKVQTASVAPSSQAALSISSSNRVSEKDQLLAQAYQAYEAGRLDDARRQYQQVLALEAGNRDALLGRAAIHVLDNQFDSAISLYQKLLLANPKDDLAMTSLISVANVDPQAGETEIKKLLNDLPESPYLHFALGNMFGNQKRWAEAQGEYFKALQYRPGDPNYAYNLAISLEHLQKPDNAIRFYQQALDNKLNALATFDDSLVMQRIEVLSQ